jgi:hypothetical protein
MERGGNKPEGQPGGLALLFRPSTFILLALAVALPLLGYLARRPLTGCALDGVKINPDYRVEVVDAGGARRAFCCIRCAQIWLGHQSAPLRAITVTDETSGEPIDAAAAWYVRSSVVTVWTTGNRIHAFRDRADAEKHAATFAGVVLSGSLRKGDRRAARRYVKEVRQE